MVQTRNRRFRGDALRVMSPAEVKSRALYTKNLFKVICLCFMERGHFWPLEATKCKKPYSGKPKIFFFRFRPPEAKNDLFTLNTKKICSKSVFFCVFWWGVILCPRRPVNVKNHIAWTQSGPKNIFFCRFPATRGQIWPRNIKCKKILFKIKFFCV